MQNNIKNLSLKIRSLRMAKNLKQADLDEEANLPRTSISKIETGKREATASELIRIAHVLGVTLDTLVSGENSFVYSEEVKVIEALREISFEDYKRIVSNIEAQVYFTAKDSIEPRKNYLQDLVQKLTILTSDDRRPRSKFDNAKRIR